MVHVEECRNSFSSSCMPENSQFTAFDEAVSTWLPTPGPETIVGSAIR